MQVRDSGSSRLRQNQPIPLTRFPPDLSDRNVNEPWRIKGGQDDRSVHSNHDLSQHLRGFLIRGEIRESYDPSATARNIWRGH